MKRVCLIAAALLLGGCAATPTTDAGALVRIVTDKEFMGAIIENCDSQGPVFGEQGNSLTDTLTPEDNKIQGAINAMRNDAGQYGADTVILTGAKQRSDAWNGDYGYEVHGVAYICNRP